MQNKQYQSFAFALEIQYVELAQKLDYCTSKTESETILLEENNYQLVYNLPENENLINSSLYYFIRSRIAFFQRNFIWFQKETLNLINLWLTKEAEVTYYINELTTDELLNILIFRRSLKSTGFSNIWIKKKDNKSIILTLNAANSLLFHQLKKEKTALIKPKN